MRLCENILSVIGLALITVSVLRLDSADFPGYKAILPVIGAVLMIAAGKDAFLNRYLLSNRVMVWFGLISYPLYIWHWPFLSFAWIVGGEMPDLKVRMGGVVLSIIMSAVTYYVIEPHLRLGQHGGYKSAGLLSAMIVIGVTGYSVMRHDGYTVRMNDPEQPVIDAISRRLYDDNQRCLGEIPDWNRLSNCWDTALCRLQREPGKNTIALIGDSHAGQLYPGLSALAGNNEGIASFPAGCAIPLIGLHSGDLRAPTEYLLSEGFGYILSHSNIRKVVMSHAPGCSYYNLFDERNPWNHDFASVLRDGFDRTYYALTKAGKEIYIVLTTPDTPRRNGLSAMRQQCAVRCLFRCFLPQLQIRNASPKRPV